MRAERELAAAEFRAQGFEQAQRITAAADREATVIKAEADREASILRGQGEGRRTEILNEAYGQDPQFFDFYRSLQAYSAALDAERDRKSDVQGKSVSVRVGLGGRRNSKKTRTSETDQNLINW